MEDKLTVPPTSVEGERDDREEGGLQREETKRKREREEERRGREGKGEEESGKCRTPLPHPPM